MSAKHLLLRRRQKVTTKMAPNVPAYNMKREIMILVAGTLLEATQTYGTFVPTNQSLEPYGCSLVAHHFPQASSAGNVA
jgi:hypothetical protein